MSLIASSHISIIIGLGVTGISVARFLQQQRVHFMVMDSRESPPYLQQFKAEFADVPVITGCLDEDDLANATEIIISPGMSLQTPELQKALRCGVPVVGDVELFARHVTKPVIAITGSNAKSTVTTLVGELIKAAGYRVALGGNLGQPVLSLLEASVDFYVLELSSFQLETTSSLQPIAATILNLSEDHMDRYDTYADYHKAKQRIYRHAKNVIVNRQDMLTHPPLGNDTIVWSFGNNEADIRGFGLTQQDETYFLTYQFDIIVDASQLTLKGLHNYSNALAALALVAAAGIDYQATLPALIKFRGLPHRCEFVAQIDQVVYINDSKATNVGATLAAVQGFSSPASTLILIAGGQDKGADFSPLSTVVKENVGLLILIGVDALKIEKALEKTAPVVHADSIEQAVFIANSKANPGDTVLLSPACASFDMFANFEERGQKFIHAVQGLAA